MHKLFILLSMATLCLWAACSPAGSSERASESSSVESTEYSTIEEQALAAAQQFVRSQYASDAIFQQSGTIIEETDVPNRYKVLQRFDSDSRNGYNFVYRIWVQKFPSGWEFGNLAVERIDGERVLTTNGSMKDLEQNDGIGDIISAGGVEFTIAEKKPTAIRIYTDQKLSRAQLKSAIIDLRNQYGTIQFATTAKHERGDEYAGWVGEMFFDYDADEIIGKSKFLQ